MRRPRSIQSCSVRPGIRGHLATAEGQVFEAQLNLDAGDALLADGMAYAAMLEAAKGLIRTQTLELSDDADQIVAAFRERLYDTKLFFDKYAGGKFAQYLFRRHAAADRPASRDTARQIVEEAHLFVEASHACLARMAARSGPAAPVSAAVAAATETPPS